MAYKPPKYSAAGLRDSQWVTVEHTFHTEEEKTIHAYTVSLHLPDGSTFCSIAELNPDGAMELLRLLCKEAAADGRLMFGKNQIPYFWNGQKFADAHDLVRKWETDWSNIFYGAYSVKGIVPGSLYEILWANCTAMNGEETFSPFGKCPGIPLADGVAVWDAVSDEWGLVQHDISHRNGHFLPATLAEVTAASYENSRFGKFVESAMGDDEKFVIKQWLGAHLIQHCDEDADGLEKFMMLQGPGGNGKSVVVELIRQLVTDGAVAELSLDEINPQTVDKMDGKLAICSDEIGTKADLVTLKKLTSKNPITANPKYKMPFTVYPTALGTWACNTLPNIIENSDAISGRLILVTMKGKFRGTKEQVKNLGKKIGRTEFALLAKFAMEGAALVLEAGQIVLPEKIRKESTGAARRGAQIEDLAEFFEFGPYILSQKELKHFYKEWAAENGKHSFAVTTLYAEIERFRQRTHPEFQLQIIPKGSPGKYYELSPYGFSLPPRVPLVRGIRIREGMVTQKAIGLEVAPTQYEMDVAVAEKKVAEAG